MIIRNGLFSSESVSEGHPDKLADRISDRVLDAFLELDPHARVACETMLADQCVIVAGEFKTRERATFDAVRSKAETYVRSGKSCGTQGTGILILALIQSGVKFKSDSTTSRKTSTKELIARMTLSVPEIKA